MKNFEFTSDGQAWAYRPAGVTAEEKADREERFDRLLAALENDMKKSGLLSQSA